MTNVYDMIPPRAEVKEYLDGLCARYNCTAFIDDDPVSVPHRFERPEDIEITGFLAATIAWGQRPTIVRNARRMVELMDDAPWQFVMQSEAEDWDALRPFVHRTFNGDDFVYFVRALQRFYRSQGGLGGFFRAGYRQHGDLRPVLSDFRREFFAPELEPQPRTMRHLSSVDRGAACKRLNMILKWMVRRDDRGVDFGLWGDVIPASALYLRGIQVVQVPTSLLAMVDSSVGGKTAVDLSAGKNLVGAFWQPSLVVADVRTLSTVPAELFLDSCGEVIKHAVLADASLLDDLESLPLTVGDDTERLTEVVARNVAIKRDVVSADERERGLRQTLNLGHTVGHAIEAASDFSLGHGSCVAAGLCMMARAAAARGWCASETAERIERCVAAHGLPTGTDLPTETLMRYATHDKKRHGTDVNIVVPVEVGRCEVRRVSLEEFRDLIEAGR